MVTASITQPLAANYLRNKCPSKSLNEKTPYEVWYGEKPDVRHLKEFECKVLILNKSPSKGKFDNRTKESILLGHSKYSKGYRVWISEDRKVEVTCDAKVIESNNRSCDEAPHPSDHSSTTPALEPELDSEPTEINIPLTSHTPEADQEDTVKNPSDLKKT